MPTSDIDNDVASEEIPAESPEAVVALEPSVHAQALADIEAEVGRLQAAFTQLDNLRAEEQELHNAFEQAVAEEQAILQNPNGSEKQCVERLLKARATKDVREARVSAAGKRIALQADLIQYDLGEPLRMKLRHLAHDLLITKENEMVALFNMLFLPPTNVSVEQLVHNCAPVVRYRQIANWTDIVLDKDPQVQLSQLRELPGRWLASLRELVDAP